jgi:hypothetical protein
MKHFYLTILVLISTALVHAQENFSMGARSAGMGHATLCLADVWASHHNQAALGYLEDAGVSVYYENRWFTSSMSVQGATAAFPTGKWGAVGFVYSRFGDANYNQSKYGLTYGVRLAKGFSMGVGLNYHDTRLGEGYGSKGNFVAEIGVLGQIGKKVRIGFHAYNLGRAVLVKDSLNNDRLPMIFRLGAMYTFSEKVLVSLEAEKDLNLPAIVRLGIEYRPIDLLFIRVGFNTQPFAPTIGLGFHFKGFTLDVASTIHPVLGVSPQGSLTYNFALKKKKNPVTHTATPPPGPAEN